MNSAASETPVLPPGSLAGKRVLITGSSRGIGADTAGYLAAAGAKVVINFRNKEARALKVVAAIEEAGGTAIAVGADLTDPDSVAAMLETVRSAWGGLDILVLNASGGMESGMGEDYALRLNRDAQVNVLEASLPLMEARRPGGVRHEPSGALRRDLGDDARVRAGGAQQARGGGRPA